MYYKTLRIRNVQKMDRFHGKLVYLLLPVTFTGLDKRPGFLSDLYFTNPYMFNNRASNIKVLPSQFTIIMTVQCYG